MTPLLRLSPDFGKASVVLAPQKLSSSYKNKNIYLCERLLPLFIKKKIHVAHARQPQGLIQLDGREISLLRGLWRRIYKSHDVHSFTLGAPGPPRVILVLYHLERSLRPVHARASVWLRELDSDRGPFEEFRVFPGRAG